MKKYRIRLVYGTCLAVAAFGFTCNPAQAEEKSFPSIKLTNDLKAQAIFENDMDLGVDDEGETDSQNIELKSKIEGNLTEEISYLLEARGVKNYGEGGSFDIETGEATGRKDFLELRQYWVDFDNVFGADPYSIRVGRQRIREEYGLWWNRDFDAARVLYASTLLNGFIGVGQNLMDYRTSDDSFNEDDEDILRVLGEASFQYKLDHFVEGRFVYQDDHSGIEDAGQTVNNDDYDAADADLLWMGVRLKGICPKPGDAAADETQKPRYRLDLMAVAGEEDQLETSPGTGNLRNVTGSDDQDVFGWALDVGLDVPVPVMLDPVVTLGYAYGSGDDDATDGDDHAFRQTDLDGNSSKLGGFSSSINNYGSTLRPDLSNMHIATVGVTIPVTEATDLGGFYRYYRLDDADGEITAAVTGDLNGEDTDLGHGLDVVLNTNVSNQMNFHPDLLERINFKTTLGAFRAGEAYGDSEGDTALRGQFDLSVRF